MTSTTTRIVALATTAVTLLLGGCAPYGSTQAANLSRVLLVQTTTYQNQVAAKIKAERGAYASHIQDLTDAAKDQQDVGEDLELSRAAQDFQAFASTRTQDVQPAEVRDALLAVIGSTKTARIRELQVTKEAIQNFSGSLQALEDQQQALESVRTNLQQLQAENTDIETVKSWVQFGQDVKKVLDEKAKAAAGATGTNGVTLPQ
jgi:hypothetical protein